MSFAIPEKTCRRRRFLIILEGDFSLPLRCVQKWPYYWGVISGPEKSYCFGAGISHFLRYFQNDVQKMSFRHPLPTSVAGGDFSLFWKEISHSHYVAFEMTLLLRCHFGPSGENLIVFGYERSLSTLLLRSRWREKEPKYRFEKLFFFA